MLPAERQKAVLNYVAGRGFASVSELAEVFSVSEMTIRRDLSDLQEQGHLTRNWGGANVADSGFFEVSLQAKKSQFVEEKKRIGAAAAEMVNDGEIVFLDSGSTTAQVARHLQEKRITVVTNDLSIAAELAKSQKVDVMMTGGMIRKTLLHLVGPQAEASIESQRFHKVFLGVEGVDTGRGITVPDPINASAKQAMLRSAERTIVVVDHSKLGRHTLSTIVPLSEVSMLITGREASAEIVEELRKHVEVIAV